jgi:D-alanyl-D-alanine carboxypeptidase
MNVYLKLAAYSLSTLFIFSSLVGAEKDNENALPPEMQKIMHQSKYQHAIWGLYVKDLQTGQVLFD